VYIDTGFIESENIGKIIKIYLAADSVKEAHKLDFSVHESVRIIPDKIDWKFILKILSIYCMDWIKDKNYDTDLLFKMKVFEPSKGGYPCQFVTYH